MIMSKNIVIFQLVAFFLLLFSSQAVSEECKGVDVDHPYHDEICFIQSQGWTDSFHDKKFKPDDPLKKGELSEMLTKALLDIDGETCYLQGYISSCFDDGSFSDLKDKQEEWYVGAMCYLKDKKILRYNKESEAEHEVTFYEALKMVMASLGFDANKACFTDSYRWEDKYLYSVVTNEVIDNFLLFPKYSYFSPEYKKEIDLTGKISRGYAAYLIENVYKKRDILNECSRTKNEHILISGQYGTTVRKNPYRKDGNELRYIHKNDYISIIGKFVVGGVVEWKDENGFKQKSNRWYMVYIDNKFGFIHTSTILGSTKMDKEIFDLITTINSKSRESEWGEAQEAWHPFGGYGESEEICAGLGDERCKEHIAEIYESCEKKYEADEKMKWCPRMSSYSEKQKIPNSDYKKFERSLLGFSRRYKDGDEDTIIYLKPLEEKTIDHVWKKDNADYRFTGFREGNFTDTYPVVPAIKDTSWIKLNDNVKTTCIMSVSLKQVCCENTERRFCSYAISGQGGADIEDEFELVTDDGVYQNTPRGIYYLDDNRDLLVDGGICNASSGSEWTCSSFRLSNDFKIKDGKITPWITPLSDYTAGGNSKKISRTPTNFWHQMYFHPGSVSHGCVSLNDPIVGCSTGSSHYTILKSPKKYYEFRQAYLKSCSDEMVKKYPYPNYKWKIVLEIIGTAASREGEVPAKMLVHD
jgi:hypothetical protein